MLGAEIDGDLGKLSGGPAGLWKTCVASHGQALLGKGREREKGCQSSLDDGVPEAAFFNFL